MLPLRVLLAQPSGRLSTATAMSWCCLCGASPKRRERVSPVGPEIPAGIQSEVFENALVEEGKVKLGGKKGVNPYLKMLRM